MKKVLRIVFLLAKPYWKQELIGLIFTILYAIAVYLVPLASQYLIDKVIPADSYNILSFGILLFVGVCLVQSFASYVKDQIFNRISEHITYDVRKKLFYKIVHADFDFFDQVKGGNLISIIMNDGRGVSDFISKIFAVLVKNILLLLLVIFGMLMISVKITLIVLVIFALFYLITLRLGKRLREISSNIQINYDNICTLVNQTNNTIITIKSNIKEQDTEEKYNAIITKMKKDNIKINGLRILINNITSTIVVLCLAIIYGWGAVNAMQGNLSVGQVVALGLYFQLLEGPFFEITNIGINTNVIRPIFDRMIHTII